MKSIDARLTTLERKAKSAGPAVVLLFGDDPMPANATERTTVLRFDDEDRDL